MKVEIELKNYPQVTLALRRLSSLNANVVDPTFRKWLQYVHKSLKKRGYPPQRPGQKYIRTKKLVNSWGTGRRRKTGEWMIDNSASLNGKYYAGYVVGPKNGAKGTRQAYMHKGRWWHADEEAASHLPELVKMANEEIQKIWQGK